MLALLPNVCVRARARFLCLTRGAEGALFEPGAFELPTAFDRHNAKNAAFAFVVHLAARAHGRDFHDLLHDLPAHVVFVAPR